MNNNQVGTSTRSSIQLAQFHKQHTHYFYFFKYFEELHFSFVKVVPIQTATPFLV